jgi:hypothetical protein
MLRLIALASLLALSCHAAIAQQPTQAQRDALRAACRSDFIANCAGVQPGGRDALMCLVRNAAKLSAPCGAAVSAVTDAAKAAPAAAPPAPSAKKPSAPATADGSANSPSSSNAEPNPSRPSPQQLNALRTACRSDFMRNCASVQPGGIEALQCLKRNGERLSVSCQRAVAAVGSNAPGSAPPPGTSVPAPTAAPLGPLPPMRPREALAILRICAVDARLLCSGTPLGGGRLLGCLVENGPRLSPECYSALAAASQ